MFSGFIFHARQCVERMIARGRERRSLREKIAELARDEEWNHQFELPGRLTTKRSVSRSAGENFFKWGRITNMFPDHQFSGKSILDVGCSDGFYSIRCGLAGARYVLGVDLNQIRLQRAAFMRDVHHVENVKFLRQDIFKEKLQDKFDIVLALGFLHRFPDINLALSVLSKIGNTLILEYKTFDSDHPVVFSPNKECKSDELNRLHGIPSNQFIKAELAKLGFGDVSLSLDTSGTLKYPRTVCIARRFS